MRANLKRTQLQNASTESLQEVPRWRVGLPLMRQAMGQAPGRSSEILSRMNFEFFLVQSHDLRTVKRLVFHFNTLLNQALQLGRQHRVNRHNPNNLQNRELRTESVRFTTVIRAELCESNSLT